MRANDSRLADKLMVGPSVTMNVSQRISRLLVHFSFLVTFNLSQLGVVAQEVVLPWSVSEPGNADRTQRTELVSPPR